MHYIDNYEKNLRVDKKDYNIMITTSNTLDLKYFIKCSKNCFIS